jgi:uncharacterized flavoprotein (TIGR03862 family)
MHQPLRATSKESKQFMHNIGMTLKPIVAIVGAGPAGLMAAETIANSAVAASIDIHVYDAMPSAGRKFLLAGRGGLNITHSEPKAAFLNRYQPFGMPAPKAIQEAVSDFDADKLTRWVNALGISTFIGTSGRVFPEQMKAAPLLRAWLSRLKSQGVKFHTRQRLQSIALDPSSASAPLKLNFHDQLFGADLQLRATACVLALGGASWPKLGSDGQWMPWLRNLGIKVNDLQPSNCGFDCSWSEFINPRYAGAAIKNCAIAINDQPAMRGEFVITESGVEGQLIYALSPQIRETIRRQGKATMCLDLRPDQSVHQLNEKLSAPRGSRTITKHLQNTLKISDQYAALLRELSDPSSFQTVSSLAHTIKHLPLTLDRARPIGEAISSAGGVALSELDTSFMVRNCKGLFITGEMLDWEAPTGGYLLNACLASGKSSGGGVANYLSTRID